MIRVIVILAAFLAHFGLRLAIYNRVNSLGWRRRTVKRIIKLAFIETWVTAVAVLLIWYQPLQQIASGKSEWNALPVGLLVYAVVCLATGSVLGCLWLVWRPIFRVQHVNTTRRIKIITSNPVRVESLARSRHCRLSSRIPGNQILDLAIEQIDLPIASLPPSLDGYRIAHLSDIHLTGDVQSDYVKEILEHAMEFDPEMFALTGDIIDVPECIDWLPPLFEKATAKDGCYFILGNHDTRIAEPNEVRHAMQSAAWQDIGGRCELHSCRDTRVLVMGNESPWFNRPSDAELTKRRSTVEDSSIFQFCLSHSPDQFDWARKQQIDLMLCGHTHGGQGRLPIAGPILSPSWHGSRWASGDFFRDPTTMHVSRGLGGVHLLRINCRPELSLITLRANSTLGQRRNASDPSYG